MDEQLFKQLIVNMKVQNEQTIALSKMIDSLVHLIQDLMKPRVEVINKHEVQK